MNQYLSLSICLCAAMLAPTIQLQAQDTAASPPAKPIKTHVHADGTVHVGEHHEHAPPSALRKKFDEKVGLWREASQSLWAEVNEFHNGSGDVTREEQLRWGQAEQAARQAMNATFLASSDLLAQEPSHQDAGYFLVESIKYRVGTDWYEGLRAASESLLESGNNSLGLYIAAGLGAFAENDFEAAEDYLRKVSERDTLDDICKSILYRSEKLRLLWKKEKAIREAEAKADDLPRVKFRTTRGDVVVELYENEAPIAVANFLSLVEDQQYDNVAFFQVETNKVAMTGDRNGDGTGNAGYCIRDDKAQNARLATGGTLLMAKLPNPLAEHDSSMPAMIPDSGSNQFLIPYLSLPPGHGMTCFGRVIEGLDTLATLNRRTTKQEKGKVQKEPDVLISAEVMRKRDHEYKFEKLPFRF